MSGPERRTLKFDDVEATKTGVSPAQKGRLRSVSRIPSISLKEHQYSKSNLAHFRVGNSLFRTLPPTSGAEKLEVIIDASLPLRLPCPGNICSWQIVGVMPGCEQRVLAYSALYGES